MLFDYNGYNNYNGYIKMSKRFIITLITLFVIGVSATAAVFLAKGYTFSPKEKRIVGTGIITITSVPDAASVFIDGHLVTATNTTVSSLVPKEYTVRVVKEGFIPWEKNVRVEEGLVTDLKITLFPAIPTIYPLTYNGVKNPVLSPDGEKLAYIVTSGKKPGVWVWTLKSDQPIAFARAAQPHQIAQSGFINYSDATIRWSPDSKEVLATISGNNYILEDDGLNSDPRDITPILASTLKSWDDDIKTKDEARILSIKDLDSRKVASSAATLSWSPDESKFMYTSEDPSVKKTPEQSSGQAEDAVKFKVYDLETKEQFDIPDSKAHFWLPDSRHVVLVEENQVSIVDFDGTNKAVIFAGNFEDSFVFAWPDSSRLVLISSSPTPTASVPNLYGINLK